MTHRPLEEILAELGGVQDRLLEVDANDFGTRAELSNLQDALRLEASQARDEMPDDLSAERLESEIKRREDELVRYLGTRLSASAGGGAGRGGGGIDPNYVHEMHRKMDTAFRFEDKKEQLRLFKVRLADLRNP